MTTGFTVTAGWDLPVGDQSRVHAAVVMAGAATAHARLVPAERAACELTATELATNLARHAREGCLAATGGAGARADDTAVVVVAGAAAEAGS